MLGALVAQGLRPGPSLLQDHGASVFAILIAMVLANVLFLGLAYLLIPLFARIVTLKRFYLLPIIVVLAFSASYVFRSDPFDLQVLVVFGVFGYFAKKLEFDVAPLVMAFILGQILEYSIGQTINMADGNILIYLFNDRIAAGVIYLMVPVVVLVMIYRAYRRKAITRRTIIGGDIA